MRTVLQILDPSRTPSHFTTEQKSGVPTYPPATILIKKSFRIPSSGPIDHTSGSPSVSIIVHPSSLPSITPITLPSDVQS